VRSRGHEDAIYVDLHIQVAPEMTTAQSHGIAHDVQHRLRAEVPAIQDVVVHVEPGDGVTSEAESPIPALRALAEEAGVAVHDISARRIDGAYHIETHLTFDGALSLTQAHEAADRFEALARTRLERLAAMTTHIEPAQKEAEASLQPVQSANDVASAIVETLSDSEARFHTHGIQVYPIGDNWAVSLHCALDGALSVREAHDVSVGIESRLRDAIPRLDRVTVHAEPVPGTREVATGQGPARSGAGDGDGERS
jgi:divalent metal cation (Fe/Co/Zn/Cd) transporter